MTNLLAETKDKIAEVGKRIADVAWVGSQDGRLAISWQRFRTVGDIIYNAGFGSNEIPMDLVVVFNDDTYLDRREYDGAEWWEYQSPPVKQPDAASFARVRPSDDEYLFPRSLSDVVQDGAA